MTGNEVHLPVGVWDTIFSKIDDDRHLESLSLVSKHFLSISNYIKQTLQISDQTLVFLPSLLRRFPNLKHLSLSALSGDHLAPVLLQIADLNIRLESLDLSLQDCLPVEALSQFPASVLSGVKSLNLCSLTKLCDDDLKMIPCFFPKLEDLDISLPRYDCYYRDDDDDNDGMLSSRRENYNLRHGGERDVNFTDDGISVLASKLKGLRRINLQRSGSLSDAGMVSLSENCPNLEEVVLKECRYVTRSGIGFALRSCKNMKTIRIHGMSYKMGNFRREIEMDDILEALCGAPSMSEIDLCHSCLSDDILCAIAKAYLPLKSVRLSHCAFYTYHGISSFLEAYDSLDYLALEGAEFISNAEMAKLAKYLAKARVVKLNHCKNISDSTFLALITYCPLLETIEMKRTKIGQDERGFYQLISNANDLNTRVITLDLSYNRYLGNGYLRMIALACPNLETLRLRSCPLITKAGVREFFRSCRNLKHLRIDGCLGVKNLGLYRNTEKLEFLGASDSGLNDKALIDISKKCRHLVSLNVAGCEEFTAKGMIEVVDRCTKLKEISLKGCNNVTDSILPWMVFCKPNLRKIVAPTYDNELNLYLRHGCCILR